MVILTQTSHCMTISTRSYSVWNVTQFLYPVSGLLFRLTPGYESYHMWPMQQELHWLDIPKRVNYKLGVLTHRCLLSKVPVYLSNCSIPVSQVATWRHLRSTACHQLTIPRHRLSTYGRRAFAVAGPTMFNTLPDDLWDPAVSTSTFGVVEDASFLCLSARLAH